jgi:hypothetical protein
MRLSCLLGALALAGAPAMASALQLAPTSGWRTVTDRPARQVAAPDKVADSIFTFAPMPPGWHITMGPGAVLFDSRYFGAGSYTIESQIFHFPNSSNGEYGFMVGGTDLDGVAARYVVFAARGDGSVAAWERSDGRDRMLAEWRRAEAVRPSDGKEVIGNLLKLTVTPREAVLKANGLDVLVLPLEGLSLDGQFGFRVGRGVNLHSSTLNVTHRLAPVPAPRS